MTIDLTPLVQFLASLASAALLAAVPLVVRKRPVCRV
jgi:hypothetical protein